MPGIAMNLKYRCKCGTRGKFIWAADQSEAEAIKKKVKDKTVLCEECEKKERS